MQRILILMSDTGGGHRASAQALKAGFDELHPNRFTIEIIDFITDYLPWPFNQMPKAYPFLSNDAPWLWKLLYGGQTHAQQFTGADRQSDAGRFGQQGAR